MNKLVRILTSDDGEIRGKEETYWHLVVLTAGSDASFCHGEFFGGGESGCEYETKTVKRGGITCPECMEKIKLIKSVKL